MKDIIDFATWYSGMEKDKVKRAYIKYLKERIVENNKEDEHDEGDIYDAVACFRKCFIRIVISRYIKKYEKHWNVEKGDEIVIGTNNKGTLDIWLIGKDDSWIHLEEIQ